MKSKLAISGALALLSLAPALAFAGCNPSPGCALERATTLAAEQVVTEEGDLGVPAKIIAVLAEHPRRASDWQVSEALLALAPSHRRRDALLAAVVRQLGRHPFGEEQSGQKTLQAALQFAARIEDLELRQHVYQDLARDYESVGRPDLAAMTLARMPAGEARDRARLNLGILQSSAGHSVEARALAAESLSGPLRERALAVFAVSHALDGNDTAALDAIAAIADPTLVVYMLIEVAKSQIEQRRLEAALQTAHLNLERLRKGTIGGVSRDFLALELAKQLAASGARREALRLISELSDVPAGELLIAIADGYILAGDLESAAATLGELAQSEQVRASYVQTQLAQARLSSGADIASTVQSLSAAERLDALRRAALTLSTRGNDSRARELLRYAVQTALQLQSCSDARCDDDAADDTLEARPFCWPENRACELGNVAIQQAQLGFLADARDAADKLGANAYAARAWLAIADRLAAANQHRAARRSFAHSLALAGAARAPDALQLKIIGMYAHWVARHLEQADALPTLLAAARALPASVLPGCSSSEALNEVVAAHAAAGLHALAFELVDTFAACDRAGAYLAIYQGGIATDALGQ